MAVLTRYVRQLKQWGRAYARAGFAIFPVNAISPDGSCTCPRGPSCASPGKHPKMKGWQEHATTDRRTIDGWIDRWGDSLNLGIACGEASGITVLDVDVGTGGVETLRKLEEKHGKLPPTLRHRSGSGGLHYVFTHTALEHPNPNRVAFAPGLDLRHDGGLIVACPSRHGSGSQYRWLNWKPSEDPWEIIEDMPPWLVDMIEESASRSKGKRRVSGATFSGFDFASWIAKHPPSVDGENGSKIAMQVAAKAVRVARIRDFSTFLQAVESWNERCDPPWSEEELEHKFESALESWEEDGLVDIPISRNGKPVGGIKTQVDILNHDGELAGTLARDMATNTIYYRDEELRNETITDIRYLISERYFGLSVPKDDVVEAVMKVAYDRRFNSIEEYLRNLSWDGKQRIRRVPTEILGTEQSDLFSEYMVRWMVGAVSRALAPGGKMDTVLVLKGDQGARKSTFVEVLGGSWYVDSRLDLKSKDAFLNCGRAWIYEISEIESVYNAREVSEFKSFLTSKVDTFRPPYGKVSEKHPRHTVFVGTTNEDTVLHDRTGSRRFWIIPIPRGRIIDTEKAERWRDQLWAEAFARWDSGEACYLDPKFETRREAENARFEEEDLSGERALQVALRLVKEPPHAFRMSKLLRDIGIVPERIHPARKREIEQVLRKHGFASKNMGKDRLRHWYKEADLKAGKPVGRGVERKPLRERVKARKKRTKKRTKVRARQ